MKNKRYFITAITCLLVAVATKSFATIIDLTAVFDDEGDHIIHFGNNDNSDWADPTVDFNLDIIEPLAKVSCYNKVMRRPILSDDPQKLI